MLPKWHILFGLIFSFLVWLIFPITFFQATIIFLASVLIDIDHYFLYVFEKKDLSLRRAYNSSINFGKKWRKLKREDKEKYKKKQFIFHGIEFLTLIFLLSFLNNLFFYILIGLIFHLFLDILSEIYYQDPLYIKLSQIAVYIKNKNKKRFV